MKFRKSFINATSLVPAEKAYEACRVEIERERRMMKNNYYKPNIWRRYPNKYDPVTHSSRYVRSRREIFIWCFQEKRQLFIIFSSFFAEIRMKTVKILFLFVFL